MQKYASTPWHECMQINFYPVSTSVLQLYQRMGLCSSQSERIPIPFCPRSLYKIINLKFLLYVCKYHQTFRGSCSNSIPCGFLKSAESFWKESRACMHAILCAIVRVLQRMFSILDHLPLLQLSSMSLTGCFCLFFAPTVCFFFSFFVHSVEEIWRFQNFFQVEVSSTWHIRKCQSWI